MFDTQRTIDDSDRHLSAVIKECAHKVPVVLIGTQIDKFQGAALQEYMQQCPLTTETNNTDWLAAKDKYCEEKYRNRKRDLEYDFWKEARFHYDATAYVSKSTSITSHTSPLAKRVQPIPKPTKNYSTQVSGF